MALIDDVKQIIDRVSDFGWRNLFLQVTKNDFDVSKATAEDLELELLKEIGEIDLSVEGFSDFHRAGRSGVSPGNPERSLLYHAFASPDVHPTQDGQPSDKDEHYLTLEELDVIENYIFSKASNVNTKDTVIAVFAYQYRVGNRTAHQKFADFAFSRTGVSRVGTAKFNYKPSSRTFWPIPESTNEGISVLPARYGVFLAKRGKGDIDGSVLGDGNPNEDDTFIFPIHKLFSGNECLDGKTLKIKEFKEYHLNEKLRRIHEISPADGGVLVPDGFDINEFPFVRDSLTTNDLVEIKPIGSSILIVPKHHDRIIRPVEQFNVLNNKKQIVSFKVPPESDDIDNRLESSLMISSIIFDGNLYRIAPEYVNIRQEVDPNGDVNQTPNDLNELDLIEFNKKISGGGYFASHFIDDSCDGAVDVVIDGIDRTIIPAFSLVTAPDFFPLADQFEINGVGTIRRARPLSENRISANPKLKRPTFPNSFAFSKNDITITAIVGKIGTGKKIGTLGKSNRMVSYLPDSASGIFAPGWDVSLSIDRGTPFLSSLGLGSPFPEDAKLCAAIQSFWPAVAPDNGRTFGNETDRVISLGNQLPMVDEELGFHPNHPRVQSGEVASYKGWDGEYSPFIEAKDGINYINYVALEKSDYVKNTLDGLIRLDLTTKIQSEDLIERHEALNISTRALNQIINPRGNISLVEFRKIVDWTSLDNVPSQITEKGYLFVYAETNKTSRREETEEFNRLRKKIKDVHTCIVSQHVGAIKSNKENFTLFEF